MAVRFLIHASVREGRDDDFQALVARASAAANEESGTVEYMWFVDGSGNSITAETYVDEEAWASHVMRARESGIIREFLDVCEVSHTEIFGEASSAVRDALAAWNPTVYALAGGFTD